MSNSSKRVTDFFKRKEPGSREEVNSNLQTVEQAKQPKLNDKQDKEIVINEIFQPPKNYKFPKTKMGTRDRSCQQHWFDDFPWLHYDDERYLF